MRDALLRLIIALEDKASAGLRAIQGGLTSMGNAARGAASLALSVAAPLGAIGAAGVGLGISLNASAEQTEAAFTTLLGSGERAMGFLEELRAFSASTPFEFPELADAGKKLLAFGFAAEDIIPMMTSIGDAVGALGGGQPEIERVTMALGQMRAKGKVSAEEMMQLAEMGIPAWQMLADSMGLSVAEVMKLSEQGKIAGEQAIPALLAGMNATFGGAMQGQATTFNGLLSTLKDNASMALMAFTGPTFDRAKVGLQELGTLAASPQFQEFAAVMGERVGRGLDVVIAKVDRVIVVARALSSALREGGWGEVFATFEDGSNHLGNLINLFGVGEQQANAIGAAVNGGLRTALDWLNGVALPAAQQGWAWLTGTGLPAAQAGFDSVAGVVGGALRTGMEWLTGTALPALQAGWEAAQGPIAAGREALAGLLPVLDPLRAAIQPVIDGFGEGGLQGALAAIPGALPGTLTELSNLRTELTALALEGLGGLLTQAADLPQLTEGLAALGLSQPAIDAITGTLRTMGEMLTTVGGYVRAVGQWFMDDLLPPVMEAGAGFAEMLMPHIQRLGEIVQTTVMPILEDFGRFIGANLPGLISVLAPLLTGLVDVGLSVVELALKAIGVTWETYLKPAFEALGGWLEDLTGGWDNLARGAERLQGILAAVAQAISDIASGNVDFSQLFAGLQNLFGGNISVPGFAGGVQNFAGGLALVGERGPELVRLPGGSDVIPSGGFAVGGNGGGQVMNVTVNVGGSVTAERDLAETIRRELIEIGRNNITTAIP
jgi:tape measure domain-containing protein